ncbi:serine hydrolase domain-containing protein [Sphingomonas alpina]|uniref:Beta-lactamase family protein n=1 Tax=Sphingomonas alpina TaxID=653931 RepID=A0A7H0LNK9_9SPHN|nr:serine hydrolase domain-containing protein [Sphingomonas alpina]QNQ11262.1 beta-lactamase family protein [Sphingomonas alpina]
MIDRRQLLVTGALLGLSPATGFANGPPEQDNPTVDAFVKAQGFQGIVMTGRAGKPNYARAFGMADSEAGRPATIDTRYAIASISKWLTAVTVLRLVERGKLSLDAPITAVLRDYRADTGAKVTLRHLLSNTSGIPSMFLPAAKLDPDVLTREVSAADGVKLYASADLAFEPGSQFDYALTNWFIITAMVEAATGQPFQEVVRTITLDPLGLKHTDATRTSRDLPTPAASYRGTPPARMQVRRLEIMAAGGGYYSSAADLLRAAHLVFDTGFLSSTSLRELKTINAPNDNYALGGRIRSLTIDGTTRLAGWETGNTEGYRSVLGHRFDDRSTVVILNNTGMSQRTLDLFADSLFGAAPPPAS